MFAGLVRLDSRGHRVRRFGTKGVVRPRIRGRLVELFTHGGRIVVINDNEYEQHSRGGVALRAYRANGSRDLAFGRRGFAASRGVAQDRYYHPVAAAQQPDGKIVVAGSAWNGELSRVELLRFR